MNEFWETIFWRRNSVVGILETHFATDLGNAIRKRNSGTFLGNGICKKFKNAILELVIWERTSETNFGKVQSNLY